MTDPTDARDQPDRPSHLSADPPDAPPAPKPPRRKRRLPLGVDILVALVAVALVQGFVVKPFGVPSQSMEQTLRIGDRIVVNRLDHTVERGDVVVFGHGETWQQKQLPPATNPLKKAVRRFGDLTGIGPSNTVYTVKRVIGMPGDRVDCCSSDGKVRVNGKPLSEPYVYQDLAFAAGGEDCSSATPAPRCFAPLTVPQGMYLVMGDHRSQSADSVVSCRGSTGPPSSCAQFVAKERIVGPVVFRLWPFTRFGTVNP